MILGLTCCGRAIKKEEIFYRNSYEPANSYEAEILIISGHRLPVRGGGGCNAQAQLYLDIFPSQDDTNATLWVFSGSSSGWAHNNVPPRIRTSGGYDRRDTHKTSDAFLTSTSAADYNLTPLFTASTTNAPLDLESLRTRLGQTIKLGTTNTLDDITIPSNATNAPTISYTGRGSRTIAAMHLQDVWNSNWDDIGPRVSGSELNYGSSSVAVNWIGAAIMTNKPISHFVLTNPFAANANDRYNGNRAGNGVLGGWTGPQANNLRIRVHGSAIPEPEEYALVFGLFALGFVLFHRHRQKKKQRQAQVSTS